MSRRRQSAFRGDVAWHGGATYRVLSNSLSALSLSSLPLSFRLPAPSHWISPSLSHFTACPCARSSLVASVLAPDFYPPLLLSIPHLVRSSLSLQHLAHDATRESPLRIARSTPLPSSSSSSHDIHIHTCVRYARRKRERERRNSQCHVSNRARSPPCVARCARVSAARGVNLCSCALARRRMRRTAVARSLVFQSSVFVRSAGASDIILV